MKELIYNNKKFTEIDKLVLILPDCTVNKKNKLITEKNKDKTEPSTGERRLYFASKNSDEYNSFFDFETKITYGNKGNKRDFLECNSICLFKRKHIVFI